MMRSISVAGVLLLACGSIAGAQVIVAPNAYTSTLGTTDNRFPLLVTGGQRYQQDYASSQFSSLSGPELITQISFRPSTLTSQVFTATIPDIQIDFSTTSVAPNALSSTFANNVGANDAVAYGAGPLTISSSDVQGVFDTTITLTNPFLYDPTAGNLLMDVRNLSGASSNVGSEYFDAENSLPTITGRVYGLEGSPIATSGTVDGLGLITQFTFAPQAQNGTPEPGSLALFVGVGITGAAVLRRRRR